MKKFVISLVLVISSATVYSQSQSLTSTDDINESKSYALLDLGFEAKLLHLNNSGSPIYVEVEQVKKSPRSLKDILAKSKKKSNFQFHLIAGCFSNLVNAERLVKQLISDSYTASVIGKEDDLYFVAFKTFKAYSDALECLAEFKTIGIDCWVKKM